MLGRFFEKKYLIFTLIVVSINSIFIGVTQFSIADILAGDRITLEVLFQARIPRLIAIVLSGVSLSISGLIMQQLAQNKFVSPGTATTTDGAKLGILISMLLFGANLKYKLLFGFGMGFFTTVLFLLAIRRIKVKNAIFVPLMGMMIGGVIDALTTFIAYQTDQVQNINSWMQGSLTSILKGNYEMLYLIVPFIIIAFIFANRFTIAGMGEEFAINLGLNYQLVLNIGLVIVSIISTIVLLIVGNIPFLGLVVPNIVSLYRGDDIKNSIWETGLLGAIFLLVCDIIGRIVIFPYEIPISLTVGVIGSGIFLYLLVRRSKQ